VDEASGGETVVTTYRPVGREARMQLKLRRWISLLYLSGVIILLAFYASSGFSSAQVSPEAALRRMVETQFDSTRYVEILSSENTFHSRKQIVSRVCYVDGIWLLAQKESGATQWHYGGILIQDGIAYFADLAGPRLSGAVCVSCHANGLMMLDGQVLQDDHHLIEGFNDMVREQGMITAYVPPTDPLPESVSLEVDACRRCHNGKKHAKLFGFQAEAIYYQTWTEHMPPNKPLTTENRLAVMSWIRTLK
jgi:hypothetical protein